MVALGLADVERMTNLFAEDFYLDADAVRLAIAQRGMFNLIHYEPGVQWTALYVKIHLADKRSLHDAVP